jgi:hypothetical protein
MTIKSTLLSVSLPPELVVAFSGSADSDKGHTGT